MLGAQHRARALLSQLAATGIAFLIAISGHQPTPAPQVMVDYRLVIRPFLIEGSSVDEIRHQLRSKGPRDARQQARDAYTKWRLSWSWGLLEGRYVNPIKVRVESRVELFVPYIQTDDRDLAARWQGYSLALLQHEFSHLTYAIHGADILKSALELELGSGPVSIARAHQIADSVVEDIRERDSHYDSSTNHGATEGVRW